MMGLDMHTHTNGRLNKTHLTPTLPVAPVTRAIRAALAISATLLALGGCGTAIAQGNCTFTTPTSVSCEGVFTNTLPDPSLFTPVTDLTLVLGDSTNSVPTSVTPAAGLMGIDANWGGSVGVTSYADITTEGATGIFADSVTTATVNNQGSITTNVTAAGAKAMDVNAYGDVSVVNNGPINAYSTGVYDVTAVNAYSTNGNVSVDNQAAGTITATAQDGNAVAVNAYATIGAVTITNEGTISASSVYGITVGVLAQAVGGSVSVTNTGSITATSTNYQAVGILATSNTGYATVTNSGTVTAAGGQEETIGITAYGAMGATVQNYGHVTATSTYGEAIGVEAQAYRGGASVTNSGTIISSSSSPYQAAIGVLASSINGPATITNNGYVRANNAPGLAVGLETYSEHGNSSIINSGYVLAASAVGSATGLQANSVYGDVGVTNSAGATTHAVATTGVSVAYGAGSYGIGISAESTHGNVSVSNAGTVYGASLHGVGIGIRALAGGNVSVSNAAYSYITGFGAIYGSGIGIDASSTAGSVAVINAGNIFGTALDDVGTTQDINHVAGIEAQGVTGVTVENTGKGYINAHGAWYANGIYTLSDGGTTITNSKGATILASGLVAKGIYAIESAQSSAGYGVGGITVNNAGRIGVTQTGYFEGFSGPRFLQYGTGISVLSSFGGAIAVTNSGSIGVDTTRGGYGIRAYSFDSQISETNSGSITVAGSGTTNRLFGEYGKAAYAGSGINLVNSGDIAITSAPVITGRDPYSAANLGTGMEGRAGRPGSHYYQGGGDAILLNTGQLTVNSNFNYGMDALSFYGTARATNAGDITLNGFSSVGISVSVGNIVAPDTGGAIADNSGTISATGTNIAIGLRAYSRGNSVGSVPLEITNSGDVTATAQVRAQGVNAVVQNADTLMIDNSGSIYANAPINTRQFQYQGARGSAAGIHTSTYAGASTVTNSGSITAVTQENSQAPGSASGVFLDNGYSNAYHPIYGNTVLSNTGSINASLISSNASRAAKSGYVGPTYFGPSNTATGILAANTYGDVAITNAGTITASARSDHYAGGGTDNGVTAANGISAVSFVGDFKNYYGNAFTAGNIAVTNSAAGTIAATAESSDASGDTAMASGISAHVSVGSYGSSLVSAGHGITINNAGIVSATALIANDPTGLANATGISAINGSAAGFANINNTGAIYATATSPGVATATGISTTADDITVALGKTSFIVATANGAGSVATGLYASGATVSASNLGTLKAIATGTTTSAYGAELVSPGALTFTNTGLIRANADHAVAVDLTSGTTATLINTGTINAVPMVLGTNGIAVETSAPNAVIQNSGTITGKLRNGTGNFTFTNFAGGTWNAAGISTFGTGNDFIRNVGTIHLNGSTISLGSLGALGSNRFTNAAGGVITVAGSSSITMGTSTPNTFENNGTLNFQNGVAGDTLAIAGNFGGNGVIDMDVNGLNGTSDQLAIAGNVLAGNVNRVNVDLLTDPTSASTLIPLITVSGTSAAGSFVLGTVVQNKSFLDVLVSKSGVFSLSLTAPDAAASASDTQLTQATASPSGARLSQATSLTAGTSLATASPTTASPSTASTPMTASSLGVVQTASNAVRPAFGFEESVAGLSDLGTLAASTAPGVQSLMNSQIGTLEDRMGAVSQTIKGGFSVWTRAFADSGTVDPGHSAGNFGQNGNFGFDQSNSGAELGLDFALSDEFKAGALFAKSQANQSLDGNPADSGKITGDTSGLYGTWISTSGFYVDGSYRWMTFNDRLHAPTGYASIHGNADAFNLELGKTWTLQNGLQIAPQFQYTLTKVDNINAQTGSLAGFQSNGDDASRARLGVMFSKAYTPASSHAVWMPYASLSAVQELDGKNSYSVNDTFFGQTNTKGTSVLAETGVNVQVGKLSLYGGLNWQDGGALKSFFGGQVGLRYTF